MEGWYLSTNNWESIIMTNLAASDQAVSPAPVSPEHHKQALAIVKRNAGFGAITGLIPLPLLDVFALTGIQIKMISELAEVYEIPFNENAVKSYVAALIGGIVPVSPLSGVAIRAARYVPFIGPLLGIAVVPAFASALTWAIGRVFVNHFEKGGDLLSVDLETMKEQVKRGLTRKGTTAETATA
ncbi:YcjF family protein [Bradyrhizobium sp. HKCCYLRH2060]|uniref:YcjF family protein n=1 Tax=Bradyrhizobium TaxID=374 RepID=UPI0028E60211|nr:MULTISPECIES: DUF697 domain-containing protein [unclassified Bradyrhizobium]